MGALILKENLSKAVNIGFNGELFEYAWGSEMFEISLKAFKLKEHEENFPIPVTLSSIGSLTEISQCRSLKDTWDFDASKVFCSTLEELKISSLVVQYLQLPMEMKITAKFSRLILYKGGNGSIHSLDSACYVEGKFGTAVLQVPVEGGHEGGKLSVDYEGRRKLFESHERSDTLFYLTAFCNGCDNFIEPISRGYKLILVYDLLWINSKNEIPRNFPVFLEALKQIKESLRPWSNRFQLLKSRQNLIEETKESTALASVIHRDSTEPIKCFENEANVPIVEKTLHDNVFFFVLQESYEDNILSFLLLQGQDRVFADILLNCDFLDVHLAMATQSSLATPPRPPTPTGTARASMQESREVQQGKVDVINISRVIDSDDLTRNLSIKLHWDKNFVGVIPSDPKKKSEEDTSEDNIEVGMRNLHHGVLLIWPKHHSVQMFCRYRQDSVEPNVDAFESSSIHSKGFLLERVQEFLNPSVAHDFATPVGSIRSIADYEYQLRDFESAYKEVSRTAVVSANHTDYGMLANQLPTKWIRKVAQIGDNLAQDSGVERSSSTSSACNSTSTIKNISVSYLKSTPDDESVTSEGLIETMPTLSASTSDYFWEGAFFFRETGELKVKAFEVMRSDLIPNFVLCMPKKLKLLGRIASDKFLDNVNPTRLNGRDVVIVSFVPVETHSEAYFSLINNMKLKGRVIVVEPFSEAIEKFHLVLLLKDDTVLRDVNLFAPYFHNQKDDLLLGVAIFAN